MYIYIFIITIMYIYIYIINIYIYIYQWLHGYRTLRNYMLYYMLYYILLHTITYKTIDRFQDLKSPTRVSVKFHCSWCLVTKKRAYWFNQILSCQDYAEKTLFSNTSSAQKPGVQPLHDLNVIADLCRSQKLPWK